MNLTGEEWHTLDAALNGKTPRALKRPRGNVPGDGAELEANAIPFARMLLWMHLRDMYPSLSPGRQSRSLQLLVKLHEDGQ